MAGKTVGKMTGRELKSIAVVSGKIGCAFNAIVAQGIEKHAEKLGLKRKSIIYHSARDRSDKACTRELLDVLKNPNVDGIIAVSFTPEKDSLPMLLKHKVPIVFLERHIKGFNGVKVDNYSGGRKAAEYLIKKGRKKPGLLLDPQSRDTNSASSERLKGFVDRLKEDKMALIKDVNAEAAIHDIDHGRAMFEQVQNKLKKVDSLFSVAGDLVAIGFMMEARSNGVKIPRDLSLIGFDGIETAGIVEPALTTIRQPIERMGEEALNVIKEVLAGRQNSIRHINIETEFIEGGTV